MIGDKAQGDLYRITSQINPTLLNGNFLCGKGAPKWVVIVKGQGIGGDVDPRSVMIYETAERPPAGGDCAVFNYEAAPR
jgi:hypothetical protein